MTTTRLMTTLFGSLAAAQLTASLVTSAAVPQTPAHVMENLNTAKWGPAPPMLPPGAHIAVLAGDPTKAGRYTIRLLFPPNYDIPAHSHSGDENVAVVSGELFIGMGTRLDKNAGVGLGVGGFALMPANVNHFAYTKAETTILLYGVGPVDFKYVNPADDPPHEDVPKSRTNRIGTGDSRRRTRDVTKDRDVRSALVHPSELRLMCVLAHPDDESLGTGGALAKCAAEGVATYLVTATRGERGRFGDSHESPGPEIVGKAREAELLAAANELGLREVRFLDYPDGALDQIDGAEAIEKIAGHLRRIKPQVVITFGPEGAYGHPDHIAISQLTTAAIVCAADPSFTTQPALGEPHRVDKLYFIAWSPKKWAAYQTALRKLVFRVDGEERQAVPWPDWAITTVIDTSQVWPAVWRAVSCHKTQMTIYRKLEELSEEHQRSLWGTQEFYRVFSGVNGGRAQESDLFEGLR